MPTNIQTNNFGCCLLKGMVQTIDLWCCQLNGIVRTIDLDGWKLIPIVHTTISRGPPRKQLLERGHDLVRINCILMDTPPKNQYYSQKYIMEQYLANGWVCRELLHPVIEVMIAWYRSVLTKSTNCI